MEYIRFVNPAIYYDYRLNRLNRLAFGGVEQGGASVLDIKCIDSTGRPWCEHIAKHYGRFTARTGEPPVFWKFDTTKLPAGAAVNLTKKKTCHAAVTEVTDDQLGDLIASVDPGELMICDGGIARPVTDADIEGFGRQARLQHDNSA